MPNKKIIFSLVISTAVLLVTGQALAAAPTVSSVTVSATSMTVVFDQKNIVTATSDPNSALNLSNYLLKWGTGGSATTVYPLAGMPNLQSIFYTTGATDGVAVISGLNLTKDDNFSLTISNVANTVPEVMTPATKTGTVAASTDPLINYIENTTGNAQTNSCYGYPCGKAGEEIKIHGLRFDLTNNVQIHNMGSGLESVTPSGADAIVFTIPDDAPVGNNGLVLRNLGNNTFSNTKYFGVYGSERCGVVKGILTATLAADKNNVPVTLESWNSIYGETKSHSNGYYAVVAYNNSNCYVGSFDVFFTTPAGADQAAPNKTASSPSVTEGAVTDAGTTAFAIANLMGHVYGPTGSADADIGMNMVTVNVHNDYGTVKQKAITDKNGLFKVYVPTSSASNYYTIDIESHPFYNASPYLYTSSQTNITIVQGGSALSQTIRFAKQNVQGTVKTPCGAGGCPGTATASNPTPDKVVPNAHVGIHTQNWSVSQWVNAGSDGTFAFGVPAGSDYVLEVEAPYGDATFGVYSKNTYSGLTIGTDLTDLDTDIPSILPNGPRLGVPNVFGRVMAGGSPLSGAYTHLDKEGYWNGMNTTTDGKFSFTVSQSGTYHLYVDSPSASYTSYDAEVTISSSEVTNGKNLGDITLSAPNVTGKVYDPTGATPQQNIGINVCPYNAPGNCYWGNTTAQGTFGVGTVPDGTWQFNIQIFGSSVYGAPSAKLIVISGGSVTTVDGEANTGNAILNDLRLADPAVSGLKGVVYGPVGTAHESIGREANLGIREQGSAGVSTWASSNSSGQFAFGSVDGGKTYELEVIPFYGSSYSRAMYTITVAADGTVTSSTSGFTALGTRNIQVRLTNQNISGTLKTPATGCAAAGIDDSLCDKAVSGGWINLHKIIQGPMTGGGGWYGTNTNENGQFGFGGIEAGDYVIEYQSGWGSAFSNVQENITISTDVAGGTNLDLSTSGAYIIGTPAPRSDGAIRLSLPQLRGTVMKPDGITAVANAWVNVFNPNNWSIQPQGKNTDSDGKFTIGGLADGIYSMEINMPWGQGLVAPSNLTITVTSGIGTISGTGVANNVITLQYPTNTLSGSVKKGATGITNARVGANKDMGGGFVETRTDTNGNYSMKLGDGSWWVNVNPDWGTDIDWVYTDPPIRITFAGSETKTQNFSVSATDATIFGYIKKTDATAVNNCWVNVCQDRGMCNGRSTDSNGFFSIKVAAGTYRVSAFPPGELMQTNDAPDEKIVTVASSQTADAGTLTLKTKSSHIKGKVQDQAGNAISNVVVNVFKFAAPGWGMSFTDTSGNYDITVSSGTWGVMVMPMSTQYVYQGGPKQVSILDSETKSDNDFVLKLADSTIKGKVRLGSTSGDVVTNFFGGVWIKDTSVNDVLDFGGPMDDMMQKSGMMATGGPTGGGMETGGGMGTGVNNGAFQLKVPAGTYEIGVGTPPGSPYTLSQTATVTVLSDSDPNNTLGYTNVNLVVVSNDATISGHFYIDANSNGSYDSGEAVTTGIRAMVNANRVGGGWQSTESNSATGAYSLNVAAGTWYVDSFLDPMMSFGANKYMVVSADQKMTITSGSTNTLNFEVKSLNSTISGRVWFDTDGDGSYDAGEGISGVWVFVDYGSAAMLTEFKGPGGPGVGANTDANGNYSLKVAAGTYKVGAGVPPWDTRDLINPDSVTVTVASGETSSGNNLKFTASDATITGNITYGGVNRAGFVRGWSDSGRGTGAVSTDGTYSLKVSQGETWHLTAAAELSNSLYQSAETSVAVSSSSTTQDLALLPLNLIIPDSKTVTFDSSTAKTLTLSNGLILDMPAGSIATSGTVTVTVTPTVNVKPDSKERPIGLTYNFTARDSDGKEISSLAQNVTITMPYDENLIEAAGYSEDSITPKYYDETTGTWENYDTVIRDTENNKLIIITDHFSDGGPVGGDTPAAPSNLSATAQSSSSIALSWTDNSTNETGFKIYCGGVLITTTSANATSYTDTNLSASTSYSYYVKATNSSGDSSASNTASATTLSGGGGGGGGSFTDTTAPNISNISVKIGPKEATITWETNEASLSWITYGLNINYGLETKTNNYVSSHSVKLTNLAPSTIYHYQIISKDTSGNSKLSNDLTFTTLAEEAVKEIIEKPSEKPVVEMTITELQAKIQELLTQITALQAELSKITTTPAVSEIPVDYRFKVMLKYGQTSNDIKYLQIFLKAQGPDIYPEGLVTGYFGSLTKTAVIRFQEKYKSDILTSWGLTKGTGIVGSTTSAKINALLGK